MIRIDAVQTLHRFGLGPRRGDRERYGPNIGAALEAELAAPARALLQDSKLRSSQDALNAYHEFVAERAARKAAAAAAAESPNDMSEAEGTMRDGNAGRGRRPPNVIRDIYHAEIAARIDRAAEAEIGFVERLVAFWTNHFTISVKTNAVVRVLAGAFEREAIRPHVLGRFEDMLIAATKHPGMLRYLDNIRSIGPHSRVGQRRGKGLNENHAREILELHTVGVDGGYSQADVIAFARVLTGWTAPLRDRGPTPAGRFAFRPAWHEPGPQTVLGKSYAEAGVGQGEAVLRDLAHRPATARHLARKLARAFVADAPPERLVADLEQSFRTTGGDLKELARTLIRSDQAMLGPPGKFTSPQEFLWSAMRGLDVKVRVPAALRALRALGHQPWAAPSPAGFPDDTATWLAPDSLTNRLDFAEELAALSRSDADPRVMAAELLGPSMPNETREAIARAESRKQALTLLLMSPDFQRR
jgi:uncharacterized protein (DUF1800 family)